MFHCEKLVQCIDIFACVHSHNSNTEQLVILIVFDAVVYILFYLQWDTVAMLPYIDYSLHCIGDDNIVIVHSSRLLLSVLSSENAKKQMTSEFSLFSGIAEKVVDARSLPDSQPGELHPLRWRSTAVQRRGVHSKPVLTPSLSTRRRHWPAADVTALTPCRHVWPSLSLPFADTLSRLLCSAATALMLLTSRRHSSTRRSQPTSRRCWLRCFGYAAHFNLLTNYRYTKFLVV